MATQMKSFKKKLLKLIRGYQPSYNQLTAVLKEIRTEIEHDSWYQRPMRNRKIPIMPSSEQLKTFFTAFDKERDPQYKLWARLIYDTQIRVHEMVSILVNEINLVDRKILIHGKGSNGKGKKDRVVMISAEVAELLKIHLKNHSDNVFLFQNGEGKPFTVRRVQQVFMNARKRAGIDFRMSPHIGRHMGLTHLSKKAFIPIMEQSGHASGDSLKIYQHLAADQFQPQFDQAMKEFWGNIL